MSIRAFKDLLIPALKTFCNVPIIEADQTGNKPDGPHATFKITTPYMRGVGQSYDVFEPMLNQLKMSRVDEFKRVISFTAYDLDDDASFDLAQQIHDWFSFNGYDFLGSNNMVVADQSAVSNRDAFVIDGYERRNGFDITLRLTRELIQDVEYIEDIDGF